MNSGNQAKIDSYDWRLQAVTTLRGDQYWGKDGDIVLAIGHFNMGGENIWFELPNMSAVFLDSANQFFKSQDGYFVFRNFERDNKRKLSPKDFNQLMKVLQSRIGNIVYSFFALESFMNDSIPENYIFTELVERSGESEYKNRDQRYIQERFSVGRKFKEVITQIYGIHTLDEKILSNFENLKDLRDRITHLKAIDKVSSGPNDSDIWKILFERNLVNYATVVIEIIGYFLQNIETEKVPRWFNKIDLS